MIAPMKLSALEQVCQGRLVGHDLSFDSLCIDSREVKPGDLYLAISGETFDGNEYADAAVQNGAVAAVVSKEKQLSVPVLTVADTERALAEVAGHCRQHFSGDVLAITGSSGKTSTRKMLAAIMSTQGKVCATRGNQNNEIGVPLTLLELSQDHASAVVEIGARKMGDIAYLGRYVKPTVAILLNAGEAHIGEFGGYINIVKAKSEIYRTLSDNGVAVVNLDDPAAETWLADLDDKKVVTYGLELNRGLDVGASDIKQNSEAVGFTLNIHDKSLSVTLAAPGLHTVSNALAAAAAAYSIGVSLDDIGRGLELYVPEGGRQNLIYLSPSLSVIDDSYNANPSSMKAALSVLELREDYRVAVLGDMGELGGAALDLHLKVADYAAATTIESFWLLGTYAEVMAERIGDRAKVFESKLAIAEAMHELSERQACVLLKASRFVALEEVLEFYKRGVH